MSTSAIPQDQPMHENQAKARMDRGEPAIGISCGLESPVSTEICARLGYDWVMLEQQHWMWDWSKFQHGLVSIVLGGSTPFARVSHNNYTEIGQALDAGMLGIVVPMVHTAQDAKQAGEAVRYPPRGTRSLGATHAQRYGSDYLTWADDEILLMVQIESAEAVANCESILAEPTVDGCWIGPADLGRSMQIAPEIAGTDAEAAYARVVEAAQKTGTFSGMSCADGEEAARRIEQGMQFVSCGNDTRWIRRLGASDLATARAAKRPG